MTEDAKNSAVDDESTQSVNEENSPPSGEGNDASVEEAIEVDPLEAAQAEAAQMKDKLIRMAADFDNYRKRTRREVSEAEKKGRDGLLNDLLPVFDNLERATTHAEATGGAEDAASIKGLIDGITLVTKQFRDALSRLGIERVESVGQPFDPSVHEAIQHLETSEFPPGCIAAEVQPGYRQADRLVRPAMVVVAKAPANPEPVTTEETGDAGAAIPAPEETPEETPEEGAPTSTSDTETTESSDEESPEA